MNLQIYVTEVIFDLFSKSTCFLKIDYFYFMYMSGLLAYVHTTCMSGTQGSQKRELEPLEMELITVVSHGVSAWTQTSSLLQE